MLQVYYGKEKFEFDYLVLAMGSKYRPMFPELAGTGRVFDAGTAASLAGAARAVREASQYAPLPLLCASTSHAQPPLFGRLALDELLRA